MEPDSFILTFFADVLFAFVVFAAAIIILRMRQHRGEILLRGVSAGLTALLIAKSSGLIYYRERPFVEMGLQAHALNPHNNSFPSDHALIVFAAAFVVWVATKNWKLGLPLVIGGVLVGWARIIALVHWPLDIVGSFAIALIMVLIWFTVPLPAMYKQSAKNIDRFLDHKFPKLRRTK